MKPFLSLALTLPLLSSSALGAAFPSHNPAVDLAYRDAKATEEGARRTVLVQGSRDSGADPLALVCGSGDAACDCLYYVNANDNPLRETALSVGAMNNAVTCVIPGGHEVPDQVHYVRLHARTSDWTSPMLAIQAELTLKDVLGSLDQKMVRGIYHYRCERTFFEGEGVSANQVTCTAGQHLGVITAPYSYYLYQSQLENNFASRGTDVAFPGPICGSNVFLSTSCSSSAPELRYGLYGTGSGPFTVQVSMTANPTGGAANYGFVALPDAAGRCPLGLVKASPWMAAPQSIQPGNPGDEFYPTSFVNSGGQLNNTMVEPKQPDSFTVSRRGNMSPCSGSGDCSNATFGPVKLVQQAAYVPQKPLVCVIPASLLKDLF